MTTSKEPDFKKCCVLANELLAVANCISTFPYSIKKLVKEQTDVKICSFTTAVEKYHVLVKPFGSDSACLVEYKGAYIIFYNDREEGYRIKFSICHELGHVLLGHKMDLDGNDPLYGVQEIEANFFAAQLLMPEQLLRECMRRGYTVSIEYIMDKFVVSEEAANRRRTTLGKTHYDWRSNEEKIYDDIILKRYESFLNKIAPKNNEFDYYDDEYDRQRERDSWMYPRISR